MRYRRLIAALLIGTLSVLALGGTRARAADDYLVGSDPQPRQELSEVPGWVTLAFRTKASAKLAKILVFDATAPRDPMVATRALLYSTGSTVRAVSGAGAAVRCACRAGATTATSVPSAMGATSARRITAPPAASRSGTPWAACFPAGWSRTSPSDGA